MATVRWQTSRVRLVLCSGRRYGWRGRADGVQSTQTAAGVCLPSAAHGVVHDDAVGRHAALAEAVAQDRRSALDRLGRLVAVADGARDVVVAVRVLRLALHHVLEPVVVHVVGVLRGVLHHSGVDAPREDE